MGKDCFTVTLTQYPNQQMDKKAKTDLITGFHKAPRSNTTDFKTKHEGSVRIWRTVMLNFSGTQK